MAVETYSTARIIFKADANSQETRTYSERSVIELRMHDIGNYSLRALDVDNQNKEIFNFPLVKRDQYTFGSSVYEPDSIRGNVGTYRLWLNTNLRNKFHETLRTCLTEFIHVRSDSPEPAIIRRNSDASIDSDDNSQTRRSVPAPNFYRAPTPPKINRMTTQTSTPNSVRSSQPITTASSAPETPADIDHKNILVDVRKLSTCIRHGNGDEAARVAIKLAQQGTQLENISSHDLPVENEFQIKIQFDGNEYGVNQQGGSILMNVYESTTIGELRATFEHLYKHPLSSQDLFVNGRVALDAETMFDLRAGPNSLFVLFLVTEPKKYDQGPWICTQCNARNIAGDLRCRSCTGARTH